MARFSADLAYASCDLQFARLQTTAEATTRGPWTVDYGGGNIGGSSLNAAAWKLEGKYRRSDFGVEFLRFDFEYRAYI